MSKWKCANAVTAHSQPVSDLKSSGTLVSFVIILLTVPNGGAGTASDLWGFVFMMLVHEGAVKHRGDA